MDRMTTDIGFTCHWQYSFRGCLDLRQVSIIDERILGFHAQVTKIEEQFSEAEIVQIGLEGALPSAEWKLSTSLKDTRTRRLPKQLLVPSR
jgi:hypothetical protein